MLIFLAVKMQTQRSWRLLFLIYNIFILQLDIYYFFFSNSLLDEHKNVSILFADIVHYTEMTIQLNITELLETLNELFSSFDESSLVCIFIYCLINNEKN